MKVPSPKGYQVGPSHESLIGTTGGNPSSEAFGSAITRSIAGIGDVVSQAADYLKQQDLQAKRFQAQRDFDNFQLSIDKQQTDLFRNANPAQNNLVDQSTAMYQNAEDDFLNKSIPPELRNEVSQQTSALKVKVQSNAISAQQTALDNFYTTGLQDAFDQSRQAMGEDGSVMNLTVQRAKLDSLVNKSGLSPASKIAFQRKMYSGIEGIAYGNAVSEELANPKNAQSIASDLIDNASNNWKVTGATDAENQQVLHQMVTAGEQIAVKAVGSADLWAAMPDRARGVLTALAVQGKLTPEVIQSVHTGDLNSVASAVDAVAPEGDHRLGNIIRNPDNKLDTDPQFQNVTYEDRLSLRRDAEVQFKAAYTQQNAQQSAMDKAQVNNLLLGLHDGTAGQSEIDQARKDGYLNRIEDVLQADTILKKYQDGVDLAAQGFAKLSANSVFSPTSDDDKKMLNAMVGDSGLKAIGNKDSNYIANSLLPIVQQSRDIPTDVVGLLTGMMRNQDQAKSLWAMNTLQAIQEASPKAYQSRIPPDVASDVELWRTGKDVLPQDQLMAVINGGNDQSQRQANELLKKDATELITSGKVKVNLVDAVQGPTGTIGGLFGDRASLPQSPWVAQGLQSDFNNLFTEEYVRTGNQQLAQQNAVTALKRLWGVTHIGGATSLMKYPPELSGYPTLDNNYDWMTKQAREDLSLSGDQQFQLVSDEQTKHELDSFRSGKLVEGAVGQGVPTPGPSYQVSTVDGDGVPRLLQDFSGNPLRIGFAVTPAMVAEQTAKFAQSQAQVELALEVMKYDDARGHSMQTGIPIPQDVKDSYSKAYMKVFPNAAPQQVEASVPY